MHTLYNACCKIIYSYFFRVAMLVYNSLGCILHIHFFHGVFLSLYMHSDHRSERKTCCYAKSSYCLSNLLLSFHSLLTLNDVKNYCHEKLLLCKLSLTDVSSLKSL